MKKIWTLLLVLMLAAFIAACGTESFEEENTGGQPEESTEETPEDTAGEEIESPEEGSAEESPEEPPVEDTEESESPEEPAEDTTEETAEEETGTEIRLLEQPMTLTINGEDTERTAFLQESTENNYSVYVAEGFTFTPEEPYVDQIFYDEDGAQYMRIYTYPKAESEVSLIDEQMKGQADALQEDGASEWTPESSSDEVIGGYEASTSDQVFKTFLYEKNELYVRIAVYTKSDSGLEHAFLQMAETIE